MTFISYAQNLEDVMLWRALGHVTHGFYIDVGAWSPNIDSVTRAFYERGWRGINIEPNPEFYQQLCSARPHDQNLQVALGAQAGVLDMNFLDNPGLSTCDDSIADSHQAAGWRVERRQVQALTLQAVWQQYVPPGQEVHFLKVDVEGFEAAVLQGNNWSALRPWVVLVESTLPMSQIESFAAWEPILLENGYGFVYADGLNRFYLASERSGLSNAFKYPPNVFDNYILSNQREAEECAHRARLQAQLAQAKAQQACEQVHQHQLQLFHVRLQLWQAQHGALQAEHLANQAQHLAQQRQEQLERVYASRSWRITAGLRRITTGLGWLGRGARAWLQFKPGSRPHRLAVAMLRHLAQQVQARPGVRLFVLSWAARLRLLPLLSQLQQRVVPVQVAPATANAAAPLVPEGGGALSPWAHSVRQRLRSASTGAARGAV